MARRKNQNIPNLLHQGGNVFPVTPIRARLQVTTLGAANNEREVIDWRTSNQFGSTHNEVIDIIAMQCDFTLNAAQATAADSEADYCCALCEDPDKAITTDIIDETIFEQDDSFIHFERVTFQQHQEGTTASDGGIDIISEDNFFLFPQPFTVARNVSLILQGEGTLGNFQSLDAWVTLWYRRRFTNDAEFKQILLRQTF